MSKAEAERRVQQYMAANPDARVDDLRTRLIDDPETMLCLIVALRAARDGRPEEISREGSGLYAWLTARQGSFGTFDEKEYFLGEIALITGGASRLLGKREQAELWLDRADACFRHTLNPGPLLAMTAYGRLALRYDMRRYDEVLELLPSLENSFRKFGMSAEVVKCQLLGAVSLKDSGRSAEALSALLALSSNEQCARDASVLGVVLVNLGDLQSSQGDLGSALANYQRAASVLANADRPYIVAHLKGSIGQTLRDQGNTAAAINAFREAAADYDALAMGAQAAYTRVVTAESLIMLGRNREAEFELLGALPVIDEQKMLPEAQAALVLLRESIKQRHLNSGALAQLRQHLNEGD